MFPSVIYCYAHRWLHCSILKREASCSRWELTQRATAGEYAETRTLECSALNGTSVLHACPKAQGSMQKRGQQACQKQKWQITSRTECFWDTLGHMCIWILRDCGSVHESCSSQAKFRHKEGEHKIPPSAIDSSWEGKPVFFNLPQHSLPIVIYTNKLIASFIKSFCTSGKGCYNLNPGHQKC